MPEPQVQLTTAERVTDCIAEEFGIEDATIKPDSLFIDLGDSLDMAELVCRLEEEFHIEISDSDMDKLGDGTVKNLIDYVERKPNECNS
jgi:acyl carrier protein